MYNVLDRIKNQLHPPIKKILVIEEQPKSKAIEPEKLKEILMSELISPEQPAEVRDVFKFSNVYDFSDWYLQNMDKFTPEQRIPLQTLVATRDMISQGCECKRGQREVYAHDYFVKFWLNNQTTDIMPTLLKALNVKTILFQDFLTYPLHS